jgi:capsular exopolysaccharide synthesis family protein
MSRVYESLQRVEMEDRPDGMAGGESADARDLLNHFASAQTKLQGANPAKAEIPRGSRLVALTDPKCLAAEKFKALATRLENWRPRGELKSVLITSSVANEGKTLIAANLGVTIAKHSGSRVLLVEGDLHRPKLASLFGLARPRGLTQWCSAREETIGRYVNKLAEMPLWLLSAGAPCDQPSQILQSGKFSEAFTRLSGYFDWIVVDSPPMSPMIDVNLWLRLVDGMLIVVREGVTPVSDLEKGLASLDSPKLVGVVLNGTSGCDQTMYRGHYDSAKKARR